MRILETYNFENQTTYGINGQIKTATLINSNKLAIANDTYIEIIDIEERNSLLVKDKDSPAVIETTSTDDKSDARNSDNSKKLYFATFGDIHELIFCKTGNFLLSLEKFASFGDGQKAFNQKSGSDSFDSASEPSSSSSTAGSIGSLKVRIYTNLIESLEHKELHYGQEIPLIVPRIASKVTPNVRCNGIEMIELDMYESPDMVTCCQETGNILVKSKHNLFVFEYRQCTSQHFSYIDFFELPIVIELSFIPMQIAMVENCIAAVSNKRCCVFKINQRNSDLIEEDEEYEDDSGENGGGESTATTAPTSGDPEKDSSYDNQFSGKTQNIDDSDLFDMQNLLNNEPFDFQFGSDFVQNLLDCKCESTWQYNTKNKSSRNGNLFQTDGSMNSNRIPSLEDCPMHTKDIKVKLYDKENLMTSGFTLKKILQIQMASLKENTIRISEHFTCLDIKAIYKKSLRSDSNQNLFPVSKRFSDCIGFSFIITTTASEGYLYQFCNNDKWCRENEKPLTRYQFTAPVLAVKITDFVLHAITRETVETVTSRIGHKLFSNSLEYPELSKPFPWETSSGVDQPIFCMKLHSFMNTHFALANETNIVLISKSPTMDDFKAEGPQQIMFSSIQTRLINDDFVGNDCEKSENKNLNQRSYSIHVNKKESECNICRLLCYSFDATGSDSNAIEWTVYNLKMPTAEILATDLEENAKETQENHRQQIQTTDDLIYELLTEANIILRLATTLDLDYSPETLKKINSRFKANCQLLAEFTIKSKNPKHFHESIGYYLMCNVTFYEIYEHFFHSLSTNEVSCKPNTTKTDEGEDENVGPNNLLNPNKDSLIGLLHTMEIIVSNFAKKRSDAQFLFETHQEILLNSEKLAIYEDSDQKQQIFFGFELFKFFYLYDFNLLIELSLKSMPFLDCNLQNFLLLFKNLNTINLERNQLLLKTLILCRAKRFDAAEAEFSKFERSQIFLSLKLYWNLIFDELPNNQNNVGTENNLIMSSFSEFTENVIFRTERNDLIEGISDVFLYLLCIAEKIQLKFLIDLFVNYFALHVMQEVDANSNQIARKIFEKVLGGYFHQKFKFDTETDEKTSSSLSPQNSLTDDSDGNNEICLEDTTTTSSDGKFDKKKYYRMKKTKISKNNSSNESCEEQTTNTEDKALILLLRLYLGNLAIATRKKSNSQLLDLLEIQYTADDSDKKFNDLIKLRLNYINYLIQNKHKLRKRKIIVRKNSAENKCPPLIPNYEEIDLEQNNNNEIKNKSYNINLSLYCRPIACLEERPQYLNRMKPFGPEHFINRLFIGYSDEVLVWILKIQCLLASTKTATILNDFLYFIQSLPNLIGIESFISILLPVDLGLELMLKLSPHTIYDYAKFFRLPDSEYRTLLSQMMNLTRCKVSKSTSIFDMESDDVEDLSNSDSIDNNTPSDESYQFLSQDQYKDALNSVLDRLFKDRTFESFLNCLPVDEVNIAGKHIYRETQSSEGKIKLIRTLVMDSVDEKNVFQLMLRKGVARQRCEALLTMIESTGRQLFETSGSQQH